MGQGSSHNRLRYAIYNDDEPVKPKIPKASASKKALDVDKLMSLTIKLQRSSIKSNPTEKQTFPMLVTLAVGNTEASYRAPVDLVCVIDHSGHERRADKASNRALNSYWSI